MEFIMYPIGIIHSPFTIHGQEPNTDSGFAFTGNRTGNDWYAFKKLMIIIIFGGWNVKKTS